jgi:hypothetical protein
MQQKKLLLTGQELQIQIMCGKRIQQKNFGNYLSRSTRRNFSICFWNRWKKISFLRLKIYSGLLFWNKSAGAYRPSDFVHEPWWSKIIFVQKKLLTEPTTSPLENLLIFLKNFAYLFWKFWGTPRIVVENNISQDLVKIYLSPTGIP